MSTLLIGSEGRIGSRYKAILNSFGEPTQYWDPKNGSTSLINHDRWLIASPTETHYEYCMQAIEAGKPFLCEKPLSKKLSECREISDTAAAMKIPGFVVCNYKYAVKTAWPRSNFSISYDYYNAGDELEWSCAQLLYLDPKAKLKDKSPVWKVEVNGKPLDYTKLEKSYVRMIGDFLAGNYDELWNLNDGVKMTEAVLSRV